MANDTQSSIILLFAAICFFTAFCISNKKSIDTGLELRMPPSTIQRFRDNNNLKFLPPNRDGSDLSLPSQMAGNTSTVILEPTMGHHRRHMDAVFSVTEGIELNALALFVTTLRKSGFIGDIVFSASPREKMAPGVYEFFQHYSKAGVVIYEDVIEGEKYVLEHPSTNSTKVYLKGLYGDSMTRKSFEDPRKNRHIGVAKFELYWVWSIRYDSNIKILLIDANDTYFQQNGINGIGSGMACPHKEERNLHLYEGSKAESVKKMQNQTMIPIAYSKEVLNIIATYPVLIPSSTHGDQVAIETYLRAMVKQFDHTQCADMFCEWAFHNYLYYFGVLQGAPGIDKIIVSNQGSGSVNSLDGNKDVDLDADILYNVRMGDGHNPSWAVHQYNRNETLKSRVDEKAEDIVRWQKYTKIEEEFRSWSAMDTYKVNIQPSMGSHRHGKDAIFAIGNNADLGVLALFLMSIQETGYDGDIVLSVSRRNEMKEGVFEYLQSQTDTGLVVYEGVLLMKDGNSSKSYLSGIYPTVWNDSSELWEVEDDLRPARSWKVARFELFWAWSRNYVEGSRILLLDAKDSYFQADPFNFAVCRKKLELNFFEETLSKQNVGDIVKDMKGDMKTRKLDEKPVLSPDAVFGSKYLIDKYLKDMVRMIEKTKCYKDGCDLAAHNYIWYYEYTPYLEGVSTIKCNYRNAVNIIHSLTPDAEFNEYQFLNRDMQTSAVIIHFTHNKSVKDIFERRKVDLLLDIQRR